MASIQKLSIRGVRSFSPDDAEQVLEFYFPVTVIVGSNGCGKTTIIESLKFAVCGALPPGKTAGQAFVHDPSSIGHSAVKANVKLRFTNRAGTSMVVVRSMEVAQKKKNMTFKQLDGVLRSEDAKGNRVALSHKCSELDRQIPILLGVSKAILEHVIFCHQEEASWPLQEGAVLKKRFDDIFDSSRYSKALEVLQRNKKEYNNKAKELKADVAGLSSHKHAAKGFQREIAKYTALLEEVEDEMEQTKAQLQTNAEETARVKEIADEVDRITDDIENVKNEKFSKQAVVTKQRHMLQEDLTGDHNVRQLKEMLRGFDEEIDKQIARKRELQHEVSTRQKDVDKCRRQEKELESRKGRLEAAHEAQQERLKARYERMIQIGTTYGLSDVLSQISQTQPASQTTSQDTSYRASNSMMTDRSLDVSLQEQAPILDISPEEMQAYYRALSRKEAELKETLSTYREKRQKEEDELQAQLTDLLGRQKAIESERSKVAKQQNDARKELTQLSSQASLVSRIRKSDIEELKNRSEQLRKEADGVSNDPRRNTVAIEIKSLEGKMDALTREIEDDKEALKGFRQFTEAEQAVVVLKEQCTKELEVLQETVGDQSYLFQKFNVDSLAGLREEATGDDLVRRVEDVRDTAQEKFEAIDKELRTATDEMAQIQQKVAKASALLSHEQTALASIKGRMVDLENGGVARVRNVVGEVKEYERSIGNAEPIIDESQPQDLLSFLGSRLQDAEAESTEGIQASTIKKIFSRLKKQSPNKIRDGKEIFSCPCCLRDFDDEEEVKKFSDQYKKLSSTDSPLLKTDERNKTARYQYENWRNVVSENINEVLEYRRNCVETISFENSIAELESNLLQLNEESTRAVEAKDLLQVDFQELRDFLDETKRWAETASRISQKRALVNDKSMSLTGTSGDLQGRDMQTVEQQLSERQDAKEKYYNTMGKLNKEMTALNSRMSQMSQHAMRIEQQYRDKSVEFAKQEQLAERKTVLTDTIKQCAEDEKKFQEQGAPLREKVRKKEAEKQRMRMLGKDEEERLSGTCNSFSADVSSLKELSEQVKAYAGSSNEDELDRIMNEARSIVEQMKQVSAEISTMQPELEKLSKAVEDQERHKKNIKDNIDIIQVCHQIDELEKRVERLNEESINVEDRERIDDLVPLGMQREGLMSAKARLEGRRGEIVESIRGFKRKMSTPEYKNVEEEFRVAMIKLETTQMLVRDIEKYHSALDRALQRFHSIKIGEINKIIRDLWSLTYKGEDITNIQLVSGQEGNSKSSYNYRVAMTKGSTQLDMRGRCSAGQRVLASIVIRLALAETFCVNFGCIALDEPTVNLDHNNKRGLAIALAQIVAARAQQSNFQLIMITHDEDFVAMMKMELSSQTGFAMPEKYFQVRREEGADGKFYSKIDAIDWEELV